MTSAQLSQQRRHLFFDEPAPFSNNSLHLVKLFDGLFMGNHHAGKEPEFLTNNKITLAINLHPLELHIPIHKGLANHPYELSLKKAGQQQRLNLLPLLQIIAKMQYCLRSRCEGVVIVGRSIDSRVIAFAVAYLMVKYCWDLSQAFAFVQNKHPHAEISHKDMTILKQFNSHPERRKLSEPFETDLTAAQETILRNTMLNSATKNLPDFHGLSYHREEMSRPLFIRKVKFARLIEEVIGSEPARKSSVIASPAETSKRLTNVQKKLRQFIKEKCQPRQQGEVSIKPVKSEKGEESIFIKSKDILCRVPRKRAASRTEESPSHFREKLKDNFLAFEYKDDDFFKKSQHIKVVIPIPTLQMHVNIAQKSHTLGEEEGESQRRQKGYVIHNSKRYKGVKKCRTEESAIDAVLKQESPQKKRDNANTNLFKIKSNKTSYKKFKASHPTLRPAAGKQSQKAMRPQAEEHTSIKQNIINLNLNLQIENINLVHQRSDQEDDRPRFPSRQNQKKAVKDAYSEEL